MKKVLIVDDDEGIVDSLQLLLEEFDYSVATLMNGKAVYDLKKPYPDVILLDIWMSGIDGSDICRYLKKNKSMQHIPIIMISANKDTAQIAREAGADDFVSKPFNFVELQEKIEKYTKK
jgi:CheY-like chemotaxis protein